MTMIIGVTTEKFHSDYNFHRVRCLFYTMVTPIITATIETLAHPTGFEPV